MLKHIKGRVADLWIQMHSSKEKLFTKYYLYNTWRSEESRSGIGSTLEHTARLRSQLPVFFDEYGIKTILDAPCGDFNWFRHVNNSGLDYLGGDIVRPLIDENNKRYSDDSTRFVHLDITKDKLPLADLWLCRDALFHFSNKDIMLVLNNFLSADIRFLLTTTFPDCNNNRDIPTGSFRMINLEIEPFCLESPIVALTDSVEGWQTRVLGLWDRDSIRRVVDRV
jgi:hypothetical protein